MRKDVWRPKTASEYLEGLTPRSVQELDLSSEYHLQYPALVGLASRLEDDPRHEGLMALAWATYGWMPTILKKCEPRDFGPGQPIAKIRAAQTRIAGRELLRSLADVAPVNKSWVGTSKLLHFLSPSVFPIWDRRVAKVFGLEWPHQYNRKPIYLEYYDFVHTEVAKDYSWLRDVQERVEKEFGYRPTEVRCLEIMLFQRVAERSCPSGAVGR